VTSPTSRTPSGPEAAAGRPAADAGAGASAAAGAGAADAGAAAAAGAGAAGRLRAQIARQGPVPWSVLVGAALYGPGGFYSAGGGAGRTRDFLTSVELGPLFGAIVARALDAAWERWGCPDPWIVIEGGAGAGTLAAAVLAAAPACASALRYVAVEISPVLRSAAAERLPVEDPAQILGPRVASSADGGALTSPRDLGPLVTVTQEVPAGPFVGLVMANELLDNLPFDVYERGRSGWLEVRVGMDGDRFIEIVVAAGAEVSHQLDRLAPDAPQGGRVPWQAAAIEWVRSAMAGIESGRVVMIDYARPTAALARLPMEAWLRTYRGGGRGGAPLDDVGHQDITVDVALDQLQAGSRPATRIESQAAWLDRHGLGDLEAQAAAAWRAGASVGDLSALRARSRVNEAATLRDPAGLGGFTVCEWDVRPPR